MCCQVEVSATSWSLAQRSPTDCDASLCVIKKPEEWGGHGPHWAAAPQKTNKHGVIITLNSRACEDSNHLRYDASSPRRFERSGFFTSGYSLILELKEKIAIRPTSQREMLQGCSLQQQHSYEELVSLQYVCISKQGLFSCSQSLSSEHHYSKFFQGELPTHLKKTC